MPQHHLLPDRQGGQARVILNLVVPLAHEATDMRSRDTAGSSRAGLAQFHC
ncbi:hypothetical protein HA052_24610 [Chromobacterium haemolyticum]|uniref:Uncharacterized protein n=1 Tax=Chromobacterium fluminis TaxID=3044269 RepID=A0ABX0LBD2_9NEIS|nr:hypothetical protein [Chromobacterium haemolyticum]NHR08378.1 hypothetical protein [Chromobacterium haemolyticum]